MHSSPPAKQSILDAIKNHEQSAEYLYDRFTALDSIVHECKLHLHSEVATIFLRDRTDSEILYIAASFSDRDLFAVSTNVHIEVKSGEGFGLTGHIAYSSEIIRLHGEELRKCKLKGICPPPHLVGGICHSLLAVPILSESGRVSGVLKLENKKGEEGVSSDSLGYTLEDEQTVISVASAVSEVLERASRLEAFLTLLKPTASKLPNRDYLNEVADSIRRAFNFEGLLIYLADKKNKVLPAIVCSGSIPAQFNLLEFKYHFDTPSLATKVFHNGEPYISKDPQNDINVNQAGWKKFGIEGMLAGVPIETPENRLGVLVFWSAKNVEITATQTSTVAILCSSIAAYIVERHIERGFGKMCHTLLENLPAGVFIKDAKLRFLYCNKAFCEFVRERFESLMGKMDGEVFAKTPLIAQQFVADDTWVLENGLPMRKLERSATVEGEMKFVQVAKTPLYLTPGEPSGLQGVFIDVTTTQLAQRGNISQVGYWVWDTADPADSLRCSEDGCEMLKQSDCSLTDNEPGILKFSEIFKNVVEEDQVGIIECITGVKRAPHEFCYCFRLKAADGAVKAIEIKGKPCDDGDIRRFPGVMMGTVQDITADVIQVQKDEQEVRLSTASALVGAVRHDINNLLEVARMAWWTLGQEDNKDESWLRIRVAVETSMQLANLLDALFKDTGCEIGFYDINDIVSDAISLEAIQLNSANIQIVRRYAVGVPKVYAIRAHLLAVIQNLLRNAREASKDNSTIEISLSFESMTGPASVEGRSKFHADTVVSVQITDEGEGLSEEAVKKKFQFGFTSKGERRGNGLFSCRRIAALYGGNVTLENRKVFAGAIAEITLKGSSITNL
jgi:PAS domain S-box-containing protein